MATNLYLPQMPYTPMYDNTGTLSVEWQEFFRLLYERVGGVQNESTQELADRLAATAIELEFLMQAVTIGHY